MYVSDLVSRHRQKPTQGPSDRLLVVGHSNIRWLESFVKGPNVHLETTPEQPWSNLKLHRERTRVIWEGQSGLRIPKALSQANSIAKKHRPTAVVLQLGGNDVDCHYSTTPYKVARNLEKLAGRYLDYGARCVTICSVLPHHGSQHYKT